MVPDAKIAITILQPLLDATSPASLAYWTTPNVILTLSGARAYCDGVFWDDDARSTLKSWVKEIEESFNSLNRICDLTVSGTSIAKAPSDDFYASFEIVSETGLRQVITQTTLLDDATFDTLIKQKTLKGLLEEMKLNLKEVKDLAKYNDEDINHIAFGILLGYPDSAIIGTVSGWQVDDPFAEPLIRADIRGASYYTCPQPVYDYPRELVSDPTINAHEQLWSKILRDYYDSDFHKNLEADSEFQLKLKELGSLR